MADVFLSYKREDRATAQRLAQALGQLGFEVWWDFELLSGQAYRKVIREIISKCKAAVVLVAGLVVGPMVFEPNGAAPPPAIDATPALAPAATPAPAPARDPHAAVRAAVDAITEREWSTASTFAPIVERVVRASSRNQLLALADTGDARAQFLVGRGHFGGIAGFAQNDAQAVRLYRLAANQGMASGRNNLGAMYELGRGGLTADRAEAVRLYRLAARQGETNAQQNLTRLGETW